MARKGQKLINFHSSGNTQVPLKYLDYGEIAVRHISDGVESQLIIKTSENTSAVFVESGKVQSMINIKSDDLETKISAITSSLTAHISANGTDFANLSGSVIALSGAVIETYWTSADTKNKLDSISSNVNNLSASVVSFSATVVRDYATSADTYNAIDSLSDAVEEFSGNIISYIDNELSVVYKFKGSVSTYDELTGKTGMSNGDVWNVTNAHGEPGSEGYTPAGTNYAYVEAGGSTEAHWDALGGSVDLSNYSTTGSVANLSASVISFSSTVVTDYATIQYVKDVSGYIQTHLLGTYATSAATVEEIGKASGNSVTSAKEYTDNVSGYITTELNTLSGSVTALSASVISVETIANKAINEFKLGEISSTGASIQSGAKATYEAKGAAILDLSSLIIDCGEW